jgi:nucleoid-associated protein YgaU
MTRDVKIGLLLGLAFIFMIAFVINGLPSFRGDSNELTKTWVDFPDKQPGIGAKERVVIDWAAAMEKEPFRADNPLMDDSERFRTKLPQGPPTAKNTNPLGLQESNIVKSVAPGPINVETTDVKPALPKIYVVADGDNLALIAKKFYGDEEGNKRANIMKIFEANRNILKSPDDIQVGQKLIIPALRTSAAENKSKSGLASSFFEKVKSIGREHLSSNKGRTAEPSKKYTVREGDSLWRIAAEQLGDGSRYTEVAKLNADILSDEDSLTVGTSLKIPAR